MLVLVTGGTGFIGSHSVAALARDGHRVRLLVRDEGRIRRALVPLDVGPEALEVVTGDVTDPAAVGRAVRGCDAVLHAASVYSFDSRLRAAMRTVNARGTEVVLHAARAAKADPIVHVSTFGVLEPGRGELLTPLSPVGRPRETYLATKAVAERIARDHQSDGVPVVITYPLATLGPHDPHLGDQLTRVGSVLRGRMPIWPSGGFPLGDVRDVARLHAAVLRPDLGPRRLIGQGQYVSTREFVRVLRRVTGRRLPTAYLPASMMLPMGVLTDVVQRVVPVHIPAEYGAIYTCSLGVPVDASATDTLLGRAAVPLADTMADSVRWLYRHGHVSRRAAGRVAIDDELPAADRP